MAILLTNGECYIAHNRVGAVIKVSDIEQAIVPLSMGGEDSMENLQTACYACNQFKSNILPDDFMDRIIKIFLYQTENRCSKDMKLKIIHNLVEGCNRLVGTGGNFLSVLIVSDGKGCYTIYREMIVALDKFKE